jgi:hypothetical protein
MEDEKKYQDLAIDNFYGENPKSLDKNIESSEDYIECMEKLQSMDEKLKVLDRDVDFEINTLAIIEEAGKIKEKRKSRMELGLFVILALSILSLYAGVGLSFGLTTILISQAVIMTLIPWIMLPMTIIRNKRSGNNG